MNSPLSWSHLRPAGRTRHRSSPRAHLRRIALGVALGACAWPAAALSTQVQAASSAEGATPEAVSPAYSGNGITCNRAWVTIAGGPSSFAIGNCKQGWVAIEDRLVSGFYGAEIGGEFGGNCGWLRETEVVLNGGNGSTGCYYSRPESEYIASGRIWTHKTSGGEYTGVATENKGNCEEYGNFFPWSSSAHTANPIRSIGPSGGRLLVRYQSAHNDVYTGAAFYMVEDGSIGKGEGNWVFVNNSECNLQLKAPGEY